MPIRLFVNDFARMPEYRDDFCAGRSSYTEMLPAELVEARKPIIGDMGFLPMLLSAMMESPDLFFSGKKIISQIEDQINKQCQYNLWAFGVTKF